MTAGRALGHSDMYAEACRLCAAEAQTQACCPCPWSLQPTESALYSMSWRSKSLKVWCWATCIKTPGTLANLWILGSHTKWTNSFKNILQQILRHAEIGAAVGYTSVSRLFSLKDHIVSVLMTPLGTAMRKQSWTVHKWAWLGLACEPVC